MSLESFPKVILASRHVQTLHWLERVHPELTSKLHYDPAVRRRDVTKDVAVIGSWPIHLLEDAGAFYVIEFRQKPSRAELSCSEMIEHGAYLRRVHVHDDVGLQLLIDFARYNPGHNLESLLEMYRS